MVDVLFDELISRRFVGKSIEKMKSCGYLFNILLLCLFSIDISVVSSALISLSTLSAIKSIDAKIFLRSSTLLLSLSMH